MGIRGRSRRDFVQTIAQLAVREVFQFFGLPVNSVHRDASLRDQILLPQSMGPHQHSSQPTPDICQMITGFRLN